MNAPQVQKGEWIRLGSNGLDGLVLDIHNDGSLGVGYYQNQLKAIKEDVVWDGSHWQFSNSGPNGSYLRGAEEAMVKRGPRF
ncbi:hypothetical protein [Rhodanobacter sp. C05]|uniref:hypothetical protein n=1 Tax=Rhodanobacter sp. C05 TaxID=1945855 RepID=UPI00098745DE|nr:hypothetical protein [Rhodanobacter sp. C05]OOG36810.1 hypothetical protein B0E51_17760 [Rhodanobacter sp. C05]